MSDEESTNDIEAPDPDQVPEITEEEVKSPQA